MCAASEPGDGSHPPASDLTQPRALGFSRSLAEPAADPWSRESLRSTSGWSEHCPELAPISWLCFGDHREAATAPGRAELHKELTGEAWPYFGKNILSQRSTQSCVRPGMSSLLPWEEPKESLEQPQRAQEPLTDCNSPARFQ